MILELSKDERQILLRALVMSYGTQPPQAVVTLCDRILDMREGANGPSTVPLPVEAHGPAKPALPSAGARQDEQLPSGVSGRSQGSDQPQRAAQGTWYFGPDKTDPNKRDQLELLKVLIIAAQRST